MDEAGDMLTLPPGLADIAEDEEGGKAAEGLKKKEWDRAEKWRRMAKVVKIGKDGEGMEFEFDSRNPKLIERTWKGIPDRWRSAAWYSFLSASAKRRKDSPSQEHIIEAFHKLQSQSSADDVQIDIDVPRTINSHIMFRRRYRGGQRLLFRVLHALSLYYPDTGYVQGMASLAATLLCYYDEEKCFVMLVRMWTLRGLDKLYETGFPGLMAALDEFQKQWLDGGEVSKKLVSPSPFPPIPIHKLTKNPGRPEHRANRLRHPLVSHTLQLLDPLPRTTPRLGRVHAPRRLGPNAPIKQRQAFRRRPRRLACHQHGAH
jgi:hypothetical protein